MTDSPPDFTWLPDLALRTLGGAVVWANDDSFAEKENLIKPGPAGFQPARFGHQGQDLRRLGDPAPPRARPRRRDRAARRARRGPRRRRRHRVVQGQLPAGDLGRRDRARRHLPAEQLARTPAGATIVARTQGLRRQPQPVRGGLPATARRTSGCGSTPTAGWPGCGCTARRAPDPAFLRLGTAGPRRAGERRPGRRTARTASTPRRRT